MFIHAVTRAWRKNKTLRSGVPMLVSASAKKCAGRIAEGVGPQVKLYPDLRESVVEAGNSNVG